MSACKTSAYISENINVLVRHETIAEAYLEVKEMVDFGIPLGAGLAFGLGALGTGIAQSKIGAAGAGAVAEKPETFGSMIILVAIPETLAILGFVVASMIMVMLE